MHSSVAYADVVQALAAAASAVPAAEAHGCLCGALCLRPDYSLAEWLDEILAEPPREAGANEPFATLFEESLGVLARPGMEFEPLLPDDDAGLAGRVSALAAWCQGFLYASVHRARPHRRSCRRRLTEVLGDLGAALPRRRRRARRMPRWRKRHTRSWSSSCVLRADRLRGVGVVARQRARTPAGH